MHKLDIFFIAATILAGLGAILVYRHDHRKERKSVKKMIGIPEIVKTLGGKETLQVNIERDLEMDQLIRVGLPYDVIGRFKTRQSESV